MTSLGERKFASGQIAACILAGVGMFSGISGARAENPGLPSGDVWISSETRVLSVPAVSAPTPAMDVPTGDVWPSAEGPKQPAFQTIMPPERQINSQAPTPAADADFGALAENAWDFNAPDGVPGFGPMRPADNVQAMVAETFGEPAGDVRPDVVTASVGGLGPGPAEASEARVGSEPPSTWYSRLKRALGLR